MNTFNLLALDPGTNNFAWALLTIGDELDSQGQLVGRVTHRGLIHSALRTLNNPAKEREELKAFLECIDQIREICPVNALIAERYMLRRGSGGNAIEAINQMLGVLRTLDIPSMKMIPASEWKNAANRLDHDLEGVYSELDARGSQLVSEPEHITVHEIDAAHIGAYGACLLLGVQPKQFDIALTVSEAEVMHLGSYTKTKKKKRRRK